MGYSLKRIIFFSAILFTLINPSFVLSNESKIIDSFESKISFRDISQKFKSNPLEYGNFSPESEEIGNQETFWSLDVSAGIYVQILATLLSVGEKCYVYMANETIEELGESTAISNCNYYRDEFDDVIYDKNIEFMGDPDGRFGDIDGDPKVTIFVAPLNGAGGLYLQKDEIETSTYTNLREMIYIDSRFGTRSGALTTIMHEFNHLIWFNYEMDELHYLLEGVAEFSVCYAGYLSSRGNLTWFTDEFEENHQRSLIFVHEQNNVPLPEDYGSSYLYILYLVEQFGIDIIRNLVLATQDGAIGVDYALNAIGSNDTFNDVFLNWITACVIDSETFDNGKYGFTSVDFRVDIDEEVNSIPHEMLDVKHYPYGFHVKKFIQPPDEFTFSITNPYPTYSVGISIVFKDQNGWNINQLHHRESSEIINIEITGEEITEAYIITSLMYANTPTTLVDFVNVGEESHYFLDYMITEGHNQHSSISAKLNGLTIIVFTVVIINHTRQKKKKER